MPSGRGRRAPPNGGARIVSDRAGVSDKGWPCCHPNCHSHLIYRCVSEAGARVKCVESELTSTIWGPAGRRGSSPRRPAARPPLGDGEAVIVHRAISPAGTLALGGQLLVGAAIVAGRRRCGFDCCDQGLSPMTPIASSCSPPVGQHRTLHESIEGLILTELGNLSEWSGDDVEASWQKRAQERSA